MLREFWSITIGEKIPINLFELLDSEVAAGAVLEEAFVPLLDRRVSNVLQGLNSSNAINLEPRRQMFQLQAKAANYLNEAIII